MAKKEAKYVDGYVFVVKKKNLAKYKKMAQEGKKLWMKHGALDYKECVGDDLNPNMGETMLLFADMTKAKKDETVWFSFITYESKAHRNKVNKAVMKGMEDHPEKNNMEMPFDMKKMAYGGFKVLV